MPVYEMAVPATVYLKMEAETVEQAVEQTDALIEDASMGLPNLGFGSKIGEYSAHFFFGATKPRVHRVCPDGTDPKAPDKFDMNRYMRMCMEEEAPPTCYHYRYEEPVRVARYKYAGMEGSLFGIFNKANIRFAIVKCKFQTITVELDDLDLLNPQILNGVNDSSFDPELIKG